MKPIPLNAETEALAGRIIWFESPRDALSLPIRFLAYVMARATIEDLIILKKYVTDDDFREALEKAPPGIIDPRSWAYWHNRFGQWPPPPMPKRTFN